MFALTKAFALMKKHYPEGRVTYNGFMKGICHLGFRVGRVWGFMGLRVFRFRVLRVEGLQGTSRVVRLQLRAG